MMLKRLVLATGLATGFALPVSAHIDLISPTPILDGRANNFRALKVAPFGAPDIDIAAAPATEVKAGSVMDIDIEMYVYHPGEIVFLWTREFDGSDVEPVYSIPTADTPIPHHNLLHRVDVPGRDEDPMIHTQVTLPDVEGTIILVVRQVMTDKLDPNEDGSVGLNRIYYHQAAKLNLVR